MKTSTFAAFRLTLTRDLLIAFKRKNDILNPFMFFVIVVSLFPLAISPEPSKLAETLGEELGFFTRRISLETLLAARPNVINISSRNGTSLAREALKHPALDHLLSDTVETSIPANLTNCGTPKTVKALEFLVVAYP